MGQPMSNGPTGGQSDPAAGKSRPRQPRMTGRQWVILLGIALLFNIAFYYAQLNANMKSQPAQTTLSYSAFVTQVQGGHIKDADVKGTEVTGSFKSPYVLKGKKYGRYSTIITTDLTPTLVVMMQRYGVSITLANTATPLWVTLLVIVLQGLPFLLLVGLLYFGSRAAMRQQQGVFGFGQSRAKLYTEDRPTTTFADVAGVEGAKGELREIVDFL
ncbi:MAG TPA: ATP-dependent metallopeptidase FtsH/Yme1/Tma family protein, partial [Dehalococcoidia bacterium]